MSGPAPAARSRALVFWSFAAIYIVWGSTYLGIRVVVAEVPPFLSSGTRFLLELHVQADPSLTLHDAHILSGKVKHAILRAVPSVQYVLVHMEPFEGR